MPDPSRSADHPVLQSTGMSTPVTCQVAELTARILGGMGIHESACAVGDLLAALEDVEVVAVALTLLPPETDDGWTLLGERARLREWSRPGATCHLAPATELASADQALSLPWLSMRARQQDLVALPDATALPEAAAQDRRELAVHGVGALLSSALLCEGRMYGSVALARSRPGPWTHEHVGALRLLSAAFSARLASERAHRALTDAIRRGDAARASQQQFFSALGHELRTPIAAVVGAAEVLGQDAEQTAADPEAAAAAREFAAGVRTDAATILRAGERLHAVVEDLIGAGHLLHEDCGLRSTDVGEAVTDVVHWSSAPAVAAAVEITTSVPPGLATLVPPAALRQILVNLVSNAVECSPQDGRVHVVAVPALDGAGHRRVRITVKDTGPGLSRAQVGAVFTPYSRVAETGVGGTGLGLSLARAVTERYGGLMGVESTPGEGSAFWVDLPAPDPTR